MKKIIFYSLAILSIGIYIAGCNQFDEYESSEVLSKPTAELSVSAVGDSSFTLDISTDMAGYLGYVVSSDTANSSIEAISILSLSLEEGEDVVDTEIFQLESAGGETLSIGGLMPNTYYKVFAASNNTDGVESDVESYLLKTDDGIGPTFVSSSPGISPEAAVTAGSDIVLTFDEPIQVDTNKVFTFTYYYEDVTEEISVDTSHVSGNNITVPQTHTGHAGDYFFLSWEAGAVTDLSGNPCDERISGVIDGYLRGNYYRFEHINFSVTDKSIIPESDSKMAVHDFVVDINFPYEIFLAEELGLDMVKFKYSNWLGTITKEVSASENCEIVNNTTLRITQPHLADHGDNIALYLDEGVILDKYGNVNDLSDYELNWDLGDFVIPGAITPAPGSVVTSQIFNVSIEFDFPVSVVPNVEADALTMTYMEEDGSENTYIPDYGIDPENDSVLVIRTPQPVNFGSTVILNIDENVVQDAEGNVNLELQELVYWEVPKLASSIDVLIGQFIVSGISYFDGSTVTDTITIELNEDTPNSVIVTGFFKSLLGESEPVIGNYDEENSLLSIDEQVIGTGDDRIYTVFSNATADFAIRTFVLEDGTMKSDLAMGVYDGGFGWLGYGEYLPSVTWTKISTKSARINTKRGTGINKVRIKEIPKKIN